MIVQKKKEIKKNGWVLVLFSLTTESEISSKCILMKINHKISGPCVFESAILLKQDWPCALGIHPKETNFEEI